jgi:hypothetical protein
MTLLKQHHGNEEPDAQKAVKEDLPKESAAKKVFLNNEII